MKPHNQTGSVLPVVVIVVLVLTLIAVGFFAATTYQDKQKFRNDTDKLIAAAVSSAKQQQAVELQQKADQESKKPYKFFRGPVAHGSVSFQYPKTWSALVDQGDKANPINGYFYPDILPNLDDATAFVLRVEQVDADYAQVLQSYDSDIKSGAVRAVAYKPPKMVNVPNVQVGTLLRGKFNDKFDGIVMVIKVRDKTLKVYTQSNKFAADYSGVVLKSLTFNP